MSTRAYSTTLILLIMKLIIFIISKYQICDVPIMTAICVECQKQIIHLEYSHEQKLLILWKCWALESIKLVDIISDFNIAQHRERNVLSCQQQYSHHLCSWFLRLAEFNYKCYKWKITKLMPFLVINKLFVILFLSCSDVTVNVFWETEERPQDKDANEVKVKIIHPQFTTTCEIF